MTTVRSDMLIVTLYISIIFRGLDIPTVDLILNHNIPNKPKNYIHRVGRTARAGIVARPRGYKTFSCST